MISKTMQSEFGDYSVNFNHGHPVTSTYKCSGFYKDTDWKECPCCGLSPKIWEFDNGRFTACGCGQSIYDHFSVSAESIMSVYSRTDGKRLNEYDSDMLRKNWLEYCATMINPCSHGDLRLREMW